MVTNCNKCGKENNVGAGFCIYCGASLTESAPVSVEAPVQTGPVNMYNTSPTVPVQMQPKKKSKAGIIIGCCLLSLFAVILMFVDLGGIINLNEGKDELSSMQSYIDSAADEVADLESRIIGAENENAELSARFMEQQGYIETTYPNYFVYKEMADYLDDNIVIIPDTGESVLYYHYYDCPNLEINEFWAMDIDTVQDYDVQPCPDCIG